MDCLNILSLNVNGLRNYDKRKVLFRKFKEQKLDIICLQETYVTEDVVNKWKKEWGGELVYSVGTGRSKGQLILLGKHLLYDHEVIHCSDRLLIIKLIVDNESICVCNAYAPNSTNEISRFMNDVTDFLFEIAVDKIIMCGDFNTVACNEKDIISGEKHSETAVNNFNDFIDDNNFYDAYRILNPETIEYSWSRMIRGNLIARRLDYIFLSEALVGDVIECNLSSFPSSDHRGVIVQIRLVKIDRGPGYWKMNNALLKERNYLDLINSTIDNFIESEQNSNISNDLKWELLKLDIKETTINYSKKRAITKKNNLLKWTNDLNDLEAILAREPNNNQLIQERARLLFNIEILDQEKTRSAYIRSKEKWIEEGDKHSKFFLNLEKVRSNSKIMSQLHLEDGSIVTDQLDILRAQKDYFENLYSINETEADDHLEQLNIFMDNSTVPTLTQEQQQDCEGRVTLDELGRALKGLNNGSSPGLDGLTTEFMKVFWNKIGKLLVDSFNTSFDKGSLSFSQSSSVITLIHKGKDLSKHVLNNWRPISLTNSDYKILAKSLANRLTGVVDSIVDKDQCGYIPFRDVANNLRVIDDVIEYLKLTNKPGVLLALDFKKAFDSISKKFMITAFRRFGFGEQFIKWVVVL